MYNIYIYICKLSLASRLLGYRSRDSAGSGSSRLGTPDPEPYFDNSTACNIVYNKCNVFYKRIQNRIT